MNSAEFKSLGCTELAKVFFPPPHRQNPGLKHRFRLLSRYLVKTSDKQPIKLKCNHVLNCALQRWSKAVFLKASFEEIPYPKLRQLGMQLQRQRQLAFVGFDLALC